MTQERTEHWYRVEWENAVTGERGVNLTRAPHALKAETSFLNASDAAGSLHRRCIRTFYVGPVETTQ